MSGGLPVWWDGQLLDPAEALVPTASQGWLWGRGVFETLAVREGRAFALTRHLDRLRAGAARLSLEVPADDYLRQAIASVLASCPPGLHRLRLTLTGAETSGLDLTLEPGHLLIRLLPATAPTEDAVLLTVPWRRNEFSPLSGLKATSYAENPIALAWARARGASEALFLNTAGDLCEGAVSNLFLIRDGVLLTPSTGSGCLPGITRSLILDLCPQLDIPCQEKALTPADLAEASEIFLTNSLSGIQPVSQCGDRILDSPGPLTARLAAAYLDLTERLCDP